METPSAGLSDSMARRSAEQYGTNFSKKWRDTSGRRLRRSFINPFSVVLMILAGITAMTGTFLKEETPYHVPSVLVILSMILLSGVVRFAQELRAKRITDRLVGLLHTTVPTLRNGRWMALDGEELVVGDLIRLKTGDRVPVDLRIISSEDCYVSEAAVTGESGMCMKSPETLQAMPVTIQDYKNTLFLGSIVTGGSCRGVVAAVGEDCLCGAGSRIIPGQKAGFDQGANSIAWVLIRFMLLLVPVVFAANGLTQGHWLTAFVFALSVAVGLTPELLPMVITACMAKGSGAMAQKQTVVKNINAMQGFGSMDILCVDKTGTLTGDTLQPEYYLDILGNESEEVLDCVYLNSFFHTTGGNYLDEAIVRLGDLPESRGHFLALEEAYEKLDELPFDYQRKSAGVLLQGRGRRFLLVKGDVDSVVSRCDWVRYRGQNIPKGRDSKSSVRAVVDEMLEDGMKVLAVACKEILTERVDLSDETELTLLGYLAFFDAPKQSAQSAIRKLRELSIEVRVLTGDHAKVAASICHRLEIPVEGLLTGAQLDTLSDDEAQVRIEQTSVFAELTPGQKARIVETLQSNGHSVGYLGDGTNDLPAAVQADVGISVDTACEAMKEAADVILLKKDLNVLEEGVLEGRRSFANMNKYIRITASSNFGNICAVVAASLFLPFLPMTSLQLLLLNLLYDILCLILPWDRVDEELCQKPLDWSGRSLPSFMRYFGSISTVFDLATYAVLYFVLCPMLCGGFFPALDGEGQILFISYFQTGWFLESMWTQVLILQLLRTKKLPFVQSCPSTAVVLVTVVGILAFSVLTVTPLGATLGLTGMPLGYYGFLTVVVSAYLLLVTFTKRYYLQKHRDLL